MGGWLCREKDKGSDRGRCCGRKRGDDWNACNLVRLVTLAAMRQAQGFGCGRCFLVMAVVLATSHGQRRLRHYCRHRAEGVRRQSQLRPQQSSNRKDREADTHLTTSEALHGDPNLSIRTGSNLTQIKQADMEPSPEVPWSRVWIGPVLACHERGYITHSASNMRSPVRDVIVDGVVESGLLLHSG